MFQYGHNYLKGELPILKHLLLDTNLIIKLLDYKVVDYNSLHHSASGTGSTDNIRIPGVWSTQPNKHRCQWAGGSG